MRILLILILLSSASAYAEIYKRTNPDGSVEFTDVPRKQKEEPVQLSPMSTFKAQPAPVPQANNSPQADTALNYTELEITDPADDTAIRSNAGNLHVTASLSPALKREHTLMLLVDGTEMDDSTTGVFELSNVDRGTHSLQAQVRDADGNVLISSKSVTVHLLRRSIR